MGTRKYVDCREVPSEKNCSLRIEGTEDEVLGVATWHAISDHGHADSPELRQLVQEALQDLDAETNEEVVRECFEAFERGDVRELMMNIADHVDWEAAVGAGSRIPIGGRRRGRQEVEDFFTKLADSVRYDSFQPQEYIAAGDRVVVTGHQSGTVIRTGRKFDSDWVITLRLREGKIVQFRSFTDTAGLLDAYGVTAQAGTTEVRPRRGADTSH